MLISALAIPGAPEQVRTAREFTALVLRAHARDDDGTAALLVSDSLNLMICLLCLFGGFSGSGLPGFRDRLCGSCGG